MSDSSFSAVTRHRRPFSTSCRPRSLDIVDDAWASATLSDDEIDVEQHEAEIAPLLEEEGGELDLNSIVVPSSSHHHHATSSSSGNGGSGTAVILGAVERRRREEGRWNDLGLDQFEIPIVMGGLFGGAGTRGANSAVTAASATSDSNGTSQRESSGSGQRR